MPSVMISYLFQGIALQNCTFWNPFQKRRKEKEQEQAS
jgi:hypothetical protein